MPILWELGYESVAVSLFIAKKKKLTQIATHSHTHRGVKAKPVCENKLCIWRGKKRQKNQQSLAKSKLIGMAP